MKTIQTEVPDRLYEQADLLVQAGWFRDAGEIVDVFLGDPFGVSILPKRRDVVLVSTPKTHNKQNFLPKKVNKLSLTRPTPHARS